MTPAAIIGWIGVAATTIEQGQKMLELIDGVVDDLFARGQITKEEQARLHAAVAAKRERARTDGYGSEWRQQPE